MVLIACHNEKRNPGAASLHHIQRIAHNTFKYIHRFCQSNIVHPFWIIRAEPCSHTACQKYGTHLAGTDSFQPDTLKLIPAGIDLIQLHGRQGRNFTFFTLFSRFFLPGGQNGKICSQNLGQQFLLLFL